MSVTAPAARKRLGEICVAQGVLTEEQCRHALEIQKRTGKRLGEILIAEQMMSEEDLFRILGGQMGFPHVWLRKGLIDPLVVKIIPKEKARLYRVIPMFKVGDELTLAAADPQAVPVFDELARLTGCRVHPILCRAADILKAIEEYYEEEVRITDFLSGLDENELQLVENRIEQDYQEIQELAEGSPIINLVNLIILKAIKDGASDIHIEPDRTKFRVRYRIDGILYEVMTPKADLHPAVVSRLKIMAKLDIAEKRLPQDGRIQVYLEGRSVDLRFSSLPGIFGEKVVLRVLDKKGAILDVNQIGFSAEALGRFKNLLRKPYGLILVTGPTGSGKTTTLYSAINFLNSLEKNLVTIEDPVEYQLDVINQNQVEESIGLSFARILRHVLRQDPDVVMVGEIRDRETAEIAIQASLTGHLVLSTVHTNDGASTINRLIDMGIERYLLAASLSAVIAQRLVRAVCAQCKTNYIPPPSLLEELGWDQGRTPRLVKGKGCTACYDSGYKGRLGIFELLEVKTDLKELILRNPSVHEIRDYQKRKNIASLRTEGLEKAKERLTTVEEVLRSVYVE